MRLEPRAEKDVLRIFLFLTAVRPSAAARFDARLEEAKALLARMPLIGRVARSTRMLRKGYRCFVLDGYNLYYSVEGGVVRIWRVVDGRRNPADARAGHDEAPPAENHDNAAPA